MSDTSGADDTASGGLQSDMPSIGAASPKPSQVPSALGGLAQAFKQMFGGQPAPRQAQPGRSPYQFPGQSQFQPPVPPSQRWQGTTASLAIPKGAPQPPASFTPFMRSIPTRSYAQWGDPEPFAQGPQPFEVPSIYSGVSQFFGQNGSVMTIPLALGLGKYSGEFLKGMQQGQEFKAKMAREQMKDFADKLQLQQEQEHHAYGDIAAEYAALDKDMTKPIKGVSMMDAMHNQALQLGDTPMVNLIESGAKVSDIMYFQSQRDANLRDLQKANTKSDEQTAADAIWSGQSQSEGGGSLAQSLARQSQAAGGQPSTSDAGRPAETTPGGVPTQSATPNAPQQTDSGDQLPADTRDDNEKLLDGRAMQLLKGYKPTGMEFGGPTEMAKAGRRMVQIQNTLSDIASDPNLKTRQQILDAVSRRVGPEAAQDLAGYVDYTRGLGATGQAGGGPERGWYDLLTPLARKIKPPNPTTGVGGWNQANYQAQQRFRTDNATQTVLLRTNSLAADGEAVRDDLKELEKRGRSATGLDLGQVVSMAERDPLYAKLYGDWLAYNDSFNTIVTGGRHVESGTMAQVSTAPTSYASPAAFRAAMKGHMNDAYGMLEGEHRRWETAGGGKDDMPSYNPQTEKQITDMRDMDWLTGTLPGETYTFGGVTKTWRPKNSLDPHDAANWQ